MELPDIDRVTSAIKSLWSSIDAWSRKRREERVASLAYSLTPEALTLTIRDEAGWLPTSRTAESIVLSVGPFDEVTADESGRSITMVKRCRHPEGRP